MKYDVKENFRFYKFGSYHHSLKLFGFFVWSFHYMDGFGWFRIFGKGLKWKDSHRHSLTFSERNNYDKWIKIGKWIIGKV